MLSYDNDLLYSVGELLKTRLNPPCPFCKHTTKDCKRCKHNKKNANKDNLLNMCSTDFLELHTNLAEILADLIVAKTEGRM